LKNVIDIGLNFGRNLG